MKIKIYKAKKNILAIFLSLLSFCSLFAQMENTKIKDGTVSVGPEKSKPGAILELESNTKGMLTPRLTTAQRDAIPTVNLTDGLLIFNTTTGCFNYWSLLQNIWRSLCGTPPPAIFNISTIECGEVVANGTFKQGVALTLSNYLTIPVTVTQPGIYTVSATTTNGYYFTTNGVFPGAGSYVLNLAGTGTPNKGYTNGDQGDLVTILLNGTQNSCKPYIYIDTADVDFVINCGSISSFGDYFIDIPLTSSDKITVSVNPINVGFWSMNTNTVNGYSFSATGTFTDTTPNQTVELLASGTPIASGTDSFNLFSNATTTATGTCTGIPITVASVTYTMDCNSATINGTYTQDVALVASNTITLPVNVTATGKTTITTTAVNGISFSSGPINLSTLGVQNIKLTGTGTPITSGTITVTVSGSPGTAATCSIDVPVVAQPVSYTTNCTGITTSGSYAPGIAMTTANTMTIPVNVTYAGQYTIKTNTVNGISFSGTGTFTTLGAQNVIITATGKPVTGGVFSYAITANSGNGTTPCNKNISFVFRTMKVLGLGEAGYQPASASAAYSVRGILNSSANFGPAGTVQMQGFTFINGGYYQEASLKNLINSNNIDIIFIGYNYAPSAGSITILNDFVKNKKGVLLHSQESDTAGTAKLINTICGSSTVAVSGAGTTYTNPILNVTDPLLQGPFGTITGLALGSDVNNSMYLTGLPDNVTALANQSGNATKTFLIKHNTLGYVYIGDAGWVAGSATDTSTTTWPAKMSSTGLPLSKVYYPNIIVYNSILYTNTMAWAIQYVQNNTDSNYVIP